MTDIMHHDRDMRAARFAKSNTATDIMPIAVRKERTSHQLCTRRWFGIGWRGLTGYTAAPQVAAE